MNNLEHFFKNNRKSFDKLEVGASLWQGIQQELEKPAKAGKIRHINWFKWIAAAVALLLLAHLWTPSKSDETAAEAQAGLEVNDIFPDIALRNPEGQMVALSSLKGKVVLVEFWASYSKVCTEDHCYYFKPAYNTYKDKGFEIYAVSVDSSAANWLHAIERDQLDWVQVADLEGITSPVTREFSVESLPTTYLLDSEGKIIAKNIEAQELESTLNQLFAYNK